MHGDPFPRHGRRGDPRSDDEHDALGRDARPLADPRRQGGQALHGRRRRQDQSRALPDGGLLRREDRQDVRPRPGTHRRHDRQARELPGLRHGHFRTALLRQRQPHRHRARRPDGGGLPRGQEALRPARRHRHRAEHPADRQLHHVQEAGGRGGCDRPGDGYPHRRHRRGPGDRGYASPLPPACGAGGEQGGLHRSRGSGRI